MLRAIAVFGVLLIVVAAGGDRGRHGRGNAVQGRSMACFRNASDNSTLTNGERHTLERIIGDASRNASRTVCRSNSTTTLRGSAENSEGSEESGDGRRRRGGSGEGHGRGRRGRGRGRCEFRCRMNQTQFEDYVSQIQIYIDNEAPMRIQNYTTSGAQDVANAYIACMQATQFDANGNIIRNR